jgi:hypothetical protein
MFLKRVGTIEKRAKQELAEIQLAQRSRVEKLAIALDDVLDFIDSDISDLEAGQQLRAFLSRNGAVAKLRGDCAVVKEWDNGNYLPLLWKHYRSHRKVLFRLARVLKLEATSQDCALLDAMDIVLRHRRTDLIPAQDINLSFVTERWRNLVYREQGGRQFLLRRQFEVCVFYHVAAELKSNDLSIAGSEAFADYRRQCLTWEECQPLLTAYCSKVGLPSTAKEFSEHLRKQLAETAERVDRGYPKNEGSIVIDSHGVPVLKRNRARVIPKSAEALCAAVVSRMPERHLLDILANTEYWTNFNTPLRTAVWLGLKAGAGCGAVYPDCLRNWLQPRSQSGRTTHVRLSKRTYVVLGQPAARYCREARGSATGSDRTLFATGPTAGVG